MLNPFKGLDLQVLFDKVVIIFKKFHSFNLCHCYHAPPTMNTGVCVCVFVCMAIMNFVTLFKQLICKHAGLFTSLFRKHHFCTILNELFPFLPVCVASTVYDLTIPCVPVSFYIFVLLEDFFPLRLFSLYWYVFETCK